MRISDPHPGRRGWSWIEIATVVAVIGLLVQLLLPLLVASRERARRNQCADHFRQVAAALLAYHNANRSLPPAAVWNEDGVGDVTELIHSKGQVKFLRAERPIELTRENWAQLVLPYLGEETLASEFDPSVPVTDPRNRQARTTRLPVLSCPSDSWNRGDNLYAVSERDGTEAKFARGNYAINGGSQYIFEAPGWLSNPRPNGVHYESSEAASRTHGNDSQDVDRSQQASAAKKSDPVAGTFALWGNGVAGINKSFAFDDFANGRATTVLVDEVRAGVHQLDPRGVWALGQIGSSITWGLGVSGDAYGPNNQIKDADDIRGCIEMHRLLGPDYLARQRMPCCDHCQDNNQAASRSQHPGGVNIAMADGALRFVTDDVDIGLWHVMHSRATPEAILADRFDARLAGTFAPSRSEATPGASRLAAAGAVAEPQLVNSIGMPFIRIPAGEFTMGLPNAGNTAPYPKEAPAHPVRITRPFFLGTVEVTQGAFETVMGYHPSRQVAEDVDDGQTVAADRSRDPVTSVSWYEAAEFCEKLARRAEERAAGRRYRLPTEAEWEYAARAGRTTPYPFVSAWVEGDTSGIIAGKAWKARIPIEPVGSYPPNAFGVHDMCGSVFEWTHDWLGLDTYEHAPRDDPQGPGTGYLRVVRGWYWLFTGPACVVNMSPPPWRRNPFIGFRVVCEVAARARVASDRER